jgi:hypothetical protein
VEVRETASAAVAVLVRICGEHLALTLASDFKMWARHEIPKVTASTEKEKEQERAALKAAVQRRHAGARERERERERERLGMGEAQC